MRNDFILRLDVARYQSTKGNLGKPREIESCIFTTDMTE